MTTSMEPREMTPITASDRDAKRFRKYCEDHKVDHLFYGFSGDGREIRFAEHGHAERVLHMELDFVDADGIVHIVRPDESTLYGVWIFMFPDGRTLMAYSRNDEKKVRFCSWGYKHSSATTEKLHLFWKTRNDSYMFHKEAEHPEREFILCDEPLDGMNDMVQSLQWYLQSLYKGGNTHEDVV